MKNNIKQNNAAIRILCSKSIKDISLEAGVSYRTVLRYEKGESHNETLKSIYDKMKDCVFNTMR